MFEKNNQLLETGLCWEEKGEKNNTGRGFLSGKRKGSVKIFPANSGDGREEGLSISQGQTEQGWRRQRHMETHPGRRQTGGPPDLSLRKVTFPLSKISKLALPALNRLCAICNMTSAQLCQATDGITNER